MRRMAGALHEIIGSVAAMNERDRKSAQSQDGRKQPLTTRGPNPHRFRSWGGA
jgi:hypothetical protein